MSPFDLTIRSIPLKKSGQLSPELKDLLLLADPNWAMVRTYLFHSEVFGAYSDETLVGTLVLQNLNHDQSEVKNIAVREGFQGRGLGSMLLRKAIETTSDSGRQKLIIRTANSSIGQLYLYQKTGFRIHHIDSDFYIRNYPEPIWENRIQCRDQITLIMEL